jgi:hypothetical protein
VRPQFGVQHRDHLAQNTSLSASVSVLADRACLQPESRLLMLNATFDVDHPEAGRFRDSKLAIVG